MARLSRITVPGSAHHVTQRGNQRQKVFIEADDHDALYRDLLAEHCASNGVEVWSYCLMPNHVYLIMVPRSKDGLSRTLGETQRRYKRDYINARLRVTGHLFQGRFGSVAMDERHLLAAFVAMNPAKAGLTSQAVDWPWSSTPAHWPVAMTTLVKVRPLLKRVDDVWEFLSSAGDPVLEPALGQNVGWPLMSDKRLAALEKQLNRCLRPDRREWPRKGEKSGRDKDIGVNGKVLP